MLFISFKQFSPQFKLKHENKLYYIRADSHEVNRELTWLADSDGVRYFRKLFPALEVDYP